MKSESVDPRRELMYVRTFGGSALGQIENYEEIVVRTKKGPGNSVNNSTILTFYGQPNFGYIFED